MREDEGAMIIIEWMRNAAVEKAMRAIVDVDGTEKKKGMRQDNTRK